MRAGQTLCRDISSCIMSCVLLRSVRSLVEVGVDYKGISAGWDQVTGLTIVFNCGTWSLWKKASTTFFCTQFLLQKLLST
jgi:hypothetical protein